MCPAVDAVVDNVETVVCFCILRVNRARNGPRGYANRRRRGEVFLYGRLGVRRLKGEGERIQKTVNWIKESVRKHNNNNNIYYIYTITLYYIPTVVHNIILYARVLCVLHI